MKRYIHSTVLLVALMLSVSVSAFKVPDKENFQKIYDLYQDYEYEQALDLLNQEIAKNKKYAFLYVFKAKLQLELDEPDSVIVAMESALKYSKNDPFLQSLAYGMRGTAYARKRDYDNAMADYAVGLRIKPDNTWIFVERGNMLAELDRQDEAEADYNKALQYDPIDEDAYLGLGRLGLMREKYADALAQIDVAIRLVPRRYHIRIDRARALIGLEEWNMATDEIVTALKHGSYRGAFQLMLELSEQEADLLKSKFRYQMTETPGDARWPYYIAAMAMIRGNYDEAANFLNKAMRLDKNSNYYQILSAKNHIYRHDYAKALDIADKQLAQDEYNIQALEVRNEVYNRHGRSDDLRIKAAERLCEGVSKPAAFIYKRGLDQMSLHKFADALKDFNAANDEDGQLYDCAEFLVTRGDARQLTNLFDAANADYNRALDIDKRSTAVSVRALAGLGLFDEAIALLNTLKPVAEGAQPDTDTQYMLVTLYARSNRGDQAMELLQQMVDNGFGRDDLMELDYQLDNLRGRQNFRDLLDKIAQTPARNPLGDLELR